MKDPSAPVSDDEYVFRRILNKLDVYDPSLPEPILYTAFRPSADDEDGISLYREACGATSEMIAKSGGNPAGYHVVRMPVKAIRDLGLTVRPTPEHDHEIPGHVSIPEIHCLAKGAEKMARKELERALTRLAQKSDFFRKA